MVNRTLVAEKTAGLESGYQVKLPLFEGPLDLLLFLIQKEEIDIYDIPIAEITAEYLKYLKLIKLLQLDVASEFLVMAATLMSIKSQMLIPQPDTMQDVELEDPRQELVSKLIEYRLFKAAAENLEERESESTLLFPRSGESYWEDEKEEEDLVDVSLFDLLNAFQEIVDKEPGVESHDVVLEEISVRDSFNRIINLLTQKKRISFGELIYSDPRTIIKVITFLALLELMRSQLVSVKQERAFGKIWIYGRITEADGFHPFRKKP